jgi:uncharacterized damage-inducible protein DinB
MKKKKAKAGKSSRVAKASRVAKRSKPKAKKSPGAAARRRPGIMRHSREGMRAGSENAALKRAYLDRLGSEVPTTLKVMRALPDHAADFQPHEKSKSALNLLHTFCVENWGAILSTKGELPIPPKFPPPSPTLGEEIAVYERGARELVAAVEAMPDSRLSETVMFFSGPGKMAPMKVIDVLWYMLLDSIHHRGQLSVYVRQAGGKVPSIYGPTADEPWR